MNQPSLAFMPPAKALPVFDRWHVAQRDCVEWLGELPDESVDLIITDPAYESLEKHRAKGTTTRLKVSDGSSNQWFPIFPNTRFPEFFAELYRVLKRDRHAYIFCDQETMFVAKPIAEAAGFKFWKGLVWHKVAIGMGYHYRGTFEHILFLEKGKQNLRNLGISDVLSFKRVLGGYPTEKPVELAEVLVTQSSDPGALVIDPFMGSGFAGVAALKHGRRFLGCDVADTAIALAMERLSKTP